jgi:hypothetical protein
MIPIQPPRLLEGFQAFVLRFPASPDRPTAEFGPKRDFSVAGLTEKQMAKHE